MWTPGYWAWGPEGYYWVPGAWVEAPYMGALWTPGYWGFYSGRYLFYPGYWGLHIGFYGGINYGFGYMGFGYEGGYWNAGHFFYNRVYNNIRGGGVHNVYSYRANVRVANGSRASYRGGNGGVQARPGRRKEQHSTSRPLPAWARRCSTRRAYQSNRGQSAAHNHGQPRTPAVSKPVHADHNVHPTVRAPEPLHKQWRGSAAKGGSVGSGARANHALPGPALQDANILGVRPGQSLRGRCHRRAHSESPPAFTPPPARESQPGCAPSAPDILSPVADQFQRPFVCERLFRLRCRPRSSCASWM